jgi:hypothetical protein
MGRLGGKGHDLTLGAAPTGRVRFGQAGRSPAGFPGVRSKQLNLGVDGMLSPVLLVPIAFVLFVLVSDAWVYVDAQQRTGRGERVSVAVGTLRIETPEAWFLGCLVLYVIFMPLYVTATGRNPFARRS